MTDIIFQYDGILDKFIGDGIIGALGAPSRPERPQRHAGRARAALDMIAKLGGAEPPLGGEPAFPTLDIGHRTEYGPM